MAEKIGLTAVLEMSNFNSGMKVYLSGVGTMTTQTEHAAKKISGLGTAIASGFGAAIGTAVIGTIKGIAGAIQSLGAQALTAVASHERLTLSLESLMAKELARNSGTEKTIVLGQKKIELTGAEIAKIGELQQKITDETLDRNTLAAQIQEEKERIRQLTEQYGENGLTVITHKAKLAEMQNEYSKSGSTITDFQAKIDALRSKEGKIVDVTKKVIEGQMSMSEALEQAGPKAAELVKWIQQLAIQSPFTEQDVAVAFRAAMAYGFTADESKRLTQAMIDFASGTGATGDTMNSIALALGQIKAKGKLAGQEVLQLVNAGFNVRDALLQAGNVAGLTAENFASMQEKGLIPAEKAIEAITLAMEKDFGGAAKRQAGTFSGLISSLSDIKTVGLREFFTGTFKAVQPLLDKFVTSFTEGGMQEKIRAIGETVGEFVAGKLIPAFQSLWTYTTTTLIPAITEIYNWLATNIPIAIQTVSDFWTNTLLPALNNVWSFIQSYIIPVFDMVSSWFDSEGQESVGGFVNTLSTTLAPVLEFVQGLFARVVGWVQANWPLIQETVQTVLQAITDFWNEHGASLLSVITNIWEVVKTVISTAIDTILSVIRTVMLIINGDWNQAWEEIKLAAGRIWEAIKVVIWSAWDNIQRIFSVILSVLKPVWEKAWNGIKAAAATIWGNIVDGVSGWITDLISKFSDLKERIVGIGTSIVDGIKEGISNAWDTFVSWVLGKMGSIIDEIAHFLGISSPAKATMPIGEALVLGIQAGWDKQLGKMGLSGMGIKSMVPVMSSVTSNTHNVGGDTINVYVQGQNQLSLVQSWVESMRYERLNRRM